MDDITMLEINRRFHACQLRINELELAVLKLQASVTEPPVPDAYIVVNAGVVIAVHSTHDMNVEVIDLDTNDYDASVLAKAMRLPRAA